MSEIKVEAGKKIIGYLDLCCLVNIACSFRHLSTEEAGLHIAEITRDIMLIPELAVVDRKAKLPSIFTNAEEPKSILRHREELANYVREVK